MKVIPAYFTIAQIAEVGGMPTRDTRRMLMGAGLPIRYGRGHYRVSADQLREAFPALYERLHSKYVVAASKAS